MNPTENKLMVLVGVETYPEKRPAYFVTKETDLDKGDWCVFELKEGEGLGKVEFISSIEEERLRVFGVSRLITTACGLSISEYFRIISEMDEKVVLSNYQVRADVIIKMAQKLDESKLFSSTGGVHVAALFEDERFVALAEDVGRHNAIDKVVGSGIQSKVKFF